MHLTDVCKLFYYSEKVWNRNFTDGFLTYHSSSCQDSGKGTLGVLCDLSQIMRKCVLCQMRRTKAQTGADPGFLDRGFKLAEEGSICAV